MYDRNVGDRNAKNFVRNLRERTQMTGGKLTWSENEGGGTRARVDWLLSAVE